MPVLAQILHVIEPAGVLYCRTRTRRALLLLEVLRSVFDVICSHRMVCITIHPSVHRWVYFALLPLSSHLYIVQILLFCDLLFKLIWLLYVGQMISYGR